MAEEFEPIARQLTDNEAKIVEELNRAQGKAGDLGGYYLLEFEKVSALMRPSQTLNAIIDQ